MHVEITPDWDKVFEQSDKVEHEKIEFHNRYGIWLAADLYKPKDAEDNAKDRDAKRRALAEQRTRDYTEGSYVRAGGVVDPLPADAPQFVKDYYAYYKTPRGYHPRSLNSNDGWNAIGCQSFLNQPILCYANEIANPVLMIHGENAHSLYFGKDAFTKLAGDNKELMVIPGAVHTDLYDNLNCIPFDKLQGFFEKSFAK